MQNDTYDTLGRGATAEHKVSGSRFLAAAMPVDSVQEAEAQIAAIRKQMYDATHHCSAYRIGPDASVFRHNDDGEPSGTAGPPILRQLESRSLTNALVVVTRYFGGTKLGTGGLIRAYGEVAALALDAAPVETRILRKQVRLRFSYEDTSPAMYTIGRFDAQMVDTRYSEVTELWVAVRCAEVDAFLAAFVEALSGRGEAVPVA